MGSYCSYDIKLFTKGNKNVTHGKTSSMLFVVGSSVKGTSEEMKNGGSFRFKESNDIYSNNKSKSINKNPGNDYDDPLNDIVLIPITRVSSKNKSPISPSG